MSIRLMTLVWDMEQLNPTDTLVLLALADNASDEGNCFPSIGTIAKKTRLHERTVQRVCQELIEAGHLSRKNRSGRSNVFNVHPRHTATPVTAAPPAHDHPTPGTRPPHPRRTATHNHQVTINEPSEREMALTVSSVPEPERSLARIKKGIRTLPATVPNLDAEALETWVAYKREIKKPVKDASLPALAKKLAEFGEDQKAVVEQSIAFGWAGLFALKTENSNVRRTMERPTTYEIHANRLENWARDHGILGGNDSDVRNEVVTNFLHRTSGSLE